MKIISVVLTLALFGVYSSAIAQWQWVDKEGRKVYSDRSPPPDILDKDILKRPSGAAKAAAIAAKDAAPSLSTGAAAPAIAASGPAIGVDKDLEAKRKAALEADAAKRKADEERVSKTKAENCRRAKQAKATLDSGVRLSRPNAAGEAEVMDDAARAAEMRQVQTSIENECR
jgi:hypothetical protein